MPRITLAGEDLIAQKQAAQQPLNITRFIFANVPGLNPNNEVDRAAPKPPAEQIVYDAAIPPANKGYVNPAQVVYSLQVGSDVGDWDFNWIGLESAEGVLFAVAYVPLQQKRRNIPPLQIGNNITRNFLVVFDGAQALTGITIDASTWQHDFTVRLAGIDERERQSNRDIFGRACFFGSALQLEKVGSVYQLKAGTAYVEGVRVQRSTVLPIVPPGFPTTAWLDVALQRELNDVVATWSVIWGVGKADYVDTAGVQHYCVAIADLLNSNTITDSRPVENIAGSLVKHFASVGYVDQSIATRQPAHDNLTAFAGLTGAADKLPYFTGAGALSLATITAKARGLLAGVNEAAMRVFLQLGSAAVANVQTSQLDSTAGRALVMGNSGVGPFGLGDVGANIANMSELVYSGLGRVSAINTPGAPTSGAGYGIGMPHSAGMATLGGNLFLNYTTDVGGYTATPRLFARSKISAAAFGAWLEFWSTENLKPAELSPPGVVAHFARDTAPSGWLKANGAAVSRGTYAALFAAIGTTYGAGDGSTTFNLPDLRGEFLRGWDDGRGVDGGRSFGTLQADAFKSHSHALVMSNDTGSAANFAPKTGDDVTPLGGTYTTAATGDAETRPRNIAMLACIKY